MSSPLVCNHLDTPFSTIRSHLDHHSSKRKSSNCLLSLNLQPRGLLHRELVQKMKGTKPVKKKCSMKTLPILTINVRPPKVVHVKNELRLGVELRDQKLLTEEVHGLRLPDGTKLNGVDICLLYTSPSPRDS